MFAAVCCGMLIWHDVDRHVSLQLLADQGVEYIGLTEAQVLKKLGKPDRKEKDTWEYGSWHGHVHEEIRTVQFKNGKVVSATSRYQYHPEICVTLRDEPRSPPPVYVRGP
jgi:hypothetical protein